MSERRWCESSAALVALWEIQNLMGGTIEEVVDRALALDDSVVNVRKVAPYKNIRSMKCILDGWHLRLIGEVDDDGRWWRIQEIQSQASE